jgi:modification methylase
MIEIRYMDCMDVDAGLPSLEDKSFDLCLTDPPFNIKHDAKTQYRNKRDPNWDDLTAHKINYFDDMSYEEYTIWCDEWFSELRRVCKGIIIMPGNQNVWMWGGEIEKPRDLFFHYKPNCFGRSSASIFNSYEIMLLYGEFNNRPHSNVYNISLRNGFIKETKFLCPAVKPYRLFYQLIRDFQPKSVLDPFLGSGTTAEVCKRLNKRFLGYEININYKKDHDKRLRFKLKKGFDF